MRAERSHAGGVDALMLEFSLDSREGVALMCLAEALLRIPDDATRDRLIRDKIGGGDWRAHVGASPSLFVNAAAWGLLVTGKLVDTRNEGALEPALASLLRKGGEPLIRKGVDLAMRLLGRQFVTGRTIDEALVNAREREARGYTYSFDMLGEAALTAADAQRYFDAYEAAIHAIGRAAAGRGVVAGPGISVKLSALHPRYSRAQRERVRPSSTPRLARARAARDAATTSASTSTPRRPTGSTSRSISSRALAADPALAGWDGLGFVVQAYQKRARPVIDWIVALARQHRRRLMVRLVKGAYWDSEIKRAQVDGMPGYPVFTRKVHTDVAYLACAKAMLAAPDAIYPQFATPQRVHDRGDPHAGRRRALRVPVPARDGREHLRPGRRRRQARPRLPHLRAGRLARDAARLSRAAPARERRQHVVRQPHRRSGGQHRVAGRGSGGGRAEDAAARRTRTFRCPRRSCRAAAIRSGVDLADDAVLARARAATLDATPRDTSTRPSRRRGAAPSTIANPADRGDVVGRIVLSDAGRGRARGRDGARTAGRNGRGRRRAERAACLERAADLLEAERATFIALAVREAGKTLANARGRSARGGRLPALLRGAGARDAADAAAREVRSSRSRRGIFRWRSSSGQVSAALAAGNPVLAKPAEQTPLIAREAVRLLHRAGVPPRRCSCCPGAARRSARRSSPIRASPASSSPARPRSRGSSTGSSRRATTIRC